MPSSGPSRSAPGNTTAITSEVSRSRSLPFSAAAGVAMASATSTSTSSASEKASRRKKAGRKFIRCAARPA
jgi:hypothetical protein